MASSTGTGSLCPRNASRGATPFRAPVTRAAARQHPAGSPGRAIRRTVSREVVGEPLERLERLAQSRAPARASRVWPARRRCRRTPAARRRSRSRYSRCRGRRSRSAADPSRRSRAARRIPRRRRRSRAPRRSRPAPARRRRSSAPAAPRRGPPAAAEPRPATPSAAQLGLVERTSRTARATAPASIRSLSDDDAASPTA